MLTLEWLKKVDLDKLTLEERYKVDELIKELALRKKKFPILDYRPQAYQQEIIDAIRARNPDGTPKYKFIVFIWGNWVGKTQTGWYILNCASVWEQANELGLPFIWNYPLIKVVTSTWSQIMENIEPYILWTSTDEDLVKIPWFHSDKDTGPYVKKVRKDKDILKQIDMENGTTIHFWSYDQWQARLQGSSPDLTWIDEIPVRWSDFRELIRGTRKPNAQFIMTFTPTNYNKKIHDWIFGWQANKFVRIVNAKENKFADHSWMEGLSEDELRIVERWEFTPPTGLVYKSFNRENNVIPAFPIRTLWEGTKYYWAIDFWLNHPMAFLFIAVTKDWQVFIFDMIYKSWMLLWDLVKEMEKRKQAHWIEFEWIVADSAGARERSELKALWVYTKKANKRKKEWTMSNRRAGIMKINQLLALGKLFISDGCVDIINEFETHHYAENGVDGSVNKESDDALDALRYFIFSYTEFSEKRELIKQRKRIINKKIVKRKRY